MFNDCFLQAVNDQCEDLQEAMIYCTGVLPFVPKEKRYNLANAIATMANAYAFMAGMHDRYVEEHEMIRCPDDQK